MLRKFFIQKSPSPSSPFPSFKRTIKKRNRNKETEKTSQHFRAALLFSFPYTNRKTRKRNTSKKDEWRTRENKRKKRRKRTKNNHSKTLSTRFSSTFSVFQNYSTFSKSISKFLKIPLIISCFYFLYIGSKKEK